MSVDKWIPKKYSQGKEQEVVMWPEIKEHKISDASDAYLQAN